MLNWLYRWLEFRASLDRQKRELNAQLTECKTCAVLERQLSQVTREKEKLLQLLVEKPNQTLPEPETEDPLPIRNTVVNWAVKRAALEAEDRAKAIALKKTEDLEKEAGIKEKSNA